jgi:purine-binding chemotaxis protein CheW
MESNTFLTFVLGEEIFAVNVLDVLEVLEEYRVTPIPWAPLHILGIISYRGEILPVIDMRVKLNLPIIQDSHKNYLIVFILSKHGQRFSVASIVDAVNDVIVIQDDEIKPVVPKDKTYDISYMTGVIRRFIMVLDIHKLFSATDNQAISL